MKDNITLLNSDADSLFNNKIASYNADVFKKIIFSRM